LFFLEKRTTKKFFKIYGKKILEKKNYKKILEKNNIKKIYKIKRDGVRVQPGFP
jgi:hypothetical protein